MKYLNGWALPGNNFYQQRNDKRQRQVAHLYAAGPRPVLEALLAVAAGQSIDDVLADFSRIPSTTYHLIGASELPMDRKMQ